MEESEEESLKKMKCPQCGIRHIRKYSAEKCLANAENYRTIYIIGIVAGGNEDNKSLKAKKELEDMDKYYSELKD